MANRQETMTGKQSLQQTETAALDHMIKYDVFDTADNRLGTTTAFWVDRNNQPAFLGIRTIWLVGKTHVIPAWGAEVNHQTQRIRIPCTKDIISDAPSFDPEEDLDFEKRRQVLDYFEAKGTCLPATGRAGLYGEEREGSLTGEGREHQRSAEETVIPLHEEQVKVGKRAMEAGGVRLRKVVRTETVQQPVELQHEEIEIQRVAASGKPASGTAFDERDIYIPLRREEPVVEKETRLREEVKARKLAGTEQQTVSGQVRKEDVEIERQDEEHRKAA